MLIYLIDFIKDDDAELMYGISLVAAFGALMITSSVMENWYIYKGYLTSIRLRKVIIASLYAKVSKFSMKSIIETNSGKLITIISGDYQSIERLMGMISMVLFLHLST